MNLHLTGTDGAHAVQTEEMRRMRNAVHVAVTLREIAVAVGAPGNGKSFAAANAVTDVLSALDDDGGQPYRVAHLQVPKTRRAKTLYREWLHAICGTSDIDGTEYELGHMLVELLADGRTVSILDEAQHLNTDGLEQARWVFDRVDGNTPIVAVGSTNLAQILTGSDQLESRVARVVQFDGIPKPQLAATLAAYHPLFEGAEPLVIQTLANRFARRNWRKWARVLQAAVRAAPAITHKGPIDDRLARVVLEELDPRR
jgi:type II secretory pathway predicted ATPase ExeA